jgi:hypothetical protein
MNRILKHPFWSGKAAMRLGQALMLALLAFFLHHALADKEQFRQELLEASARLLAPDLRPYLALVVLLLPANWALEAWKWKRLVRKIEVVSFWQALKAVLSGLAVSFVSTYHAGNYLGRMWHLKHQDRHQVLGATVLNSLSQSMISYYFGGLGLVYFLHFKGVLGDKAALAWAVGFGVLGAAYCFLLLQHIDLVRKLRRFRRLYDYLKVVERYSMAEKAKVLGLSLLRHSTYFVQFALLLWMLHPSIPLPHLMAGISLMYLAKGALPNFSILTDLGIREVSSVFFLGEDGFGMPDAAVTASTVVVWGINMLVPVLAGAYFSMRMSVRRPEADHSPGSSRS